MTRVRRIESNADLGRFVDLPYRLHAGDPVWVPPLRADQRRLLRARGNPFFEHARAAYFLAERGGRVVGRVGAIANRRHNETWNDDVAFFGFFEVEDDDATARALLDAAAAWAREQGFGRLRGPCSPSMNHESGLLVDGFERPPTLMMAHNPPRYARAIEAAGFRPVKDLHAYCVGDDRETAPPPVPERARRASASIARRYRAVLRPFDPSRFEREIATIKDLYNRAWERNWGFVPMSDAEIDDAAKQFRPILNPDLAPFVEVDGEPIGFGLALPDINQVLRRNRSGRLWSALPRLVWGLKRKSIRRARVLLLGVVPEWRGKGIDALLWSWIWGRAGVHGIGWGEASWILDDNPGMINAAERMGFRRYKTYRIFEREID